MQDPDDNSKILQQGDGSTVLSPANTCKDLREILQVPSGEYYVLENLVAADCQLSSAYRGRCGPRHNKAFCIQDNYPWCNTDNGWCGNTDDHYKLGTNDYDLDKIPGNKACGLTQCD